MDFPVTMNDSEWRERLSLERFEVLRHAATEPAFTGDLLHVDEEGMFSCAGCGAELFTHNQKFDSGCGWPSFDACKPGSIIERVDTSHGMRRTEILCASCGGHLGHVFNDGPTESGLRYCVNSLSMQFRPGTSAPR
ncbi:MAG: peptide-methionine (R)-S-oxide reductase MsrB [Acidimicrobiaceae bacterium]|nr:peptide-methionine (R)-S-oxide reductase MsrB [Acidimicrobiaceae bacterium]